MLSLAVAAAIAGTLQLVGAAVVAVPQGLMALAEREALVLARLLVVLAVAEAPITEQRGQRVRL